MCANPWNNWLNTIAVRASYILPVKAISLVKTKKNRGWSISPRKTPKQKCCVLGFVIYYYRVKRAQTKCSTQLLYKNTIKLITHNDI